MLDLCIHLNIKRISLIKQKLFEYKYYLVKLLFLCKYGNYMCLKEIYTENYSFKIHIKSHYFHFVTYFLFYIMLRLRRIYHLFSFYILFTNSHEKVSKNKSVNILIKFNSNFYEILCFKICLYGYYRI